MGNNERRLIFTPLMSGALAIGHRPPLRALKPTREAGVTHIATVLSAAENPQAIAAASRGAGLEWLWMAVDRAGFDQELARARKARNPRCARIACGDLRRRRARLSSLLGGHPSHRNDTCALLFHIGYDDAQVEVALRALRPLTADAMGTERLEWARSFAAPLGQRD